MTQTAYDIYHFPRELREVPAGLRRVVQEQRPAVRAAAAELARANRLIWVGSGDCYFVGHALVAAFESLAHLPAAALEALDAVSAPPRLTADTAVVGFSSSGKSVYAVEALKSAARAGAATVAVVNEEESALAEAADIVLGTRAGRSFTFPTKTTSTALALGVGLAAELGRQRSVLTDAQVDEIWTQIGVDAPDAIEAAQPDTSAEAAAAASVLDQARRIVVVGSGTARTTAMIGAAKFIEASGSAASAHNAEEYLHLVGFGTRPKDAVVLIDDGLERTRLVAQYTTKHDVPTVIVTDAGPTVVESGAHYVHVPSGLGSWARLLADVSVMHALGSAVAEHRGTDPDNRDEVDLAYVINLLYTGAVDGWKGGAARQTASS